MKKIKIIFSLFLALLIFSLIGIANAADPYLYVYPESLTKNIGDEFDVFVRVSASASKVYAVEGNLNFDNLICKSISLAENLVAQSIPTCENPYFLIGVPSGTVADTAFLTVSVGAEDVGTAKISFTEVDIIGEGKSLSSVSVSGNYTIGSSEVTSKPTPAPVISQPKPVLTHKNKTKVLPVENSTIATSVSASAEVVGEVKGVKVVKPELMPTESAVESKKDWLSSSIAKTIVAVLMVIAVYIVGKGIFVKKNK